MRRRPSITDGASERWQRQRYNPWANMTPETLARAFDEWDQGWLRRGALMWENRAERDEVLAGAIPKRCGSVARLPWTVLPVDDSPAAARHQEALKDFFDRGITATDALDMDQRGGMRLLIEQAMDAVFVGKSAHEIIWTPGRMDVAAELRSVPLYFFEQLSGRLRYTGPDMTTRGADLDEGGWMIATKRRRLMKAALMCCLFKSMSLSDWISYSGRFGQPGIHGETDADPGSEEWGKAEEMVAAFAAEWAALSRTGTKINLIETGKNPNAPYEPMVDRMSRTLSMLCRGADLGTMSSRDGAGASLQADESDLLLEDDCQMVSEALQHYLARPVIRHLFGTDPLAYVEIQVPSDSDTKAEIAVDEALDRLGVQQDPEALAERYGRVIAEGATSATDAENDASGGEAEDDDETLGTLGEVLRSVISERERTRLYIAIREVLTGDGDLMEGLRSLHGRLPELVTAAPEVEAAFERFSAAATLRGWSEATDRPGSTLHLRANRRPGPRRPMRAENDAERSGAILERNIKDAEMSPMAAGQINS